MANYNAFGLNIYSSFPLLNINEEYRFERDIDVIIRKEDFIPIPSKAFVEGSYFKVTKKSVYLFWEDIGIFRITNGNLITVNPVEGLDENTISSFILGSCMGILLHQRGLLVLHASAVNMNNSIVAFLGWSGYGKSTIAMALHKKGYPIVSDDILPIIINKDDIYSYPGFSYLKISEKTNSVINGLDNLNSIDSFEKEFYIYKNKLPKKSLEIERLYIIKNNEEISLPYITNLESQKSFIELIRNSYGYKIFNKKERSLNFSQCSRLVQNVPVKQLNIPQNIKIINKIPQIIEEDVLNEK